MNRADRRRQLREDDKRIARGLDARQLDGRQLAALMRALGQRLRLSIQRRSVNPLMEFVFASLNSGGRLLADVPIACGQGCSHCCHSWVDATAAEVLFTVKQLTPLERPRALEAVEQICRQTGGKTFDARTALVTPCPLLQGNCCSVYAARPIVCRAAVSADAGICRRAYLDLTGEGVPVPSVWRSLGQAYAVALEGAIIHGGLVAASREWNESLRLALTSPDAETRWLSGEDVFDGLPRASTSSSFDAPQFAAIYREAFGAAAVKRSAGAFT